MTGHLPQIPPPQNEQKKRDGMMKDTLQTKHDYYTE